MAMTTPIASTVIAFDATQAHSFLFTSKGGNQVVKNRLTIRINATDEIVYQEDYVSYAYTHNVPANTLTNGTYYNLYFNTYDINDNMSEDSNIVTFYCYEQPTITFTNLPVMNKIEEGSYTFDVQYNQNNGEMLDGLYVCLYNSNHELIKKSDMYRSTNTPPITFQVYFEGFENDEFYFLKAFGNTVNHTPIESSEVRIEVEYDYSGIFLYCDATNQGYEGCVKLENSIVVADGYTEPDPPEFIDGNKLLLYMNQKCIFDEGFGFYSNKFLKRKWWFPVLLGVTNILYADNENDRIEIELKRGIINSVTQDFLEVRGYSNNVQYMLRRSNLMNPINSLCNMMSFVKIDTTGATPIFDIKLMKVGTTEPILTWEGLSNVEFGALTNLIWGGESSSTDGNVLTWNGTCNVPFNRLTDMFYLGEPQAQTIVEQEFYNTPDHNFQITKMVLSNSLVDHLNITKDMSITFSTDIPTEWNNYTVLNCNFNGNLHGGNLQYGIEQIDAIKVKRRMIGDTKWITLYNRPIRTEDDVTFTYKDYYLPSGFMFEYALVPCLRDQELNQFISEVITKFDGLFVTDSTKSMKLYSAVAIAGDYTTLQQGLLQPYGKRYPVVVSNPNVNYRTITISGNVLGAELCNNEFNIEDRNAMVAQKEEWIEFLTNGRTKVITDWNGNILVGKVTVAPSFMYNAQYGNGLATISFSVTEQGKYNSQDDLYKNGLIEVPA